MISTYKSSAPRKYYCWGTPSCAHGRRLTFIIQPYLYEYEKHKYWILPFISISEKHDTEWNTFNKSHAIIILYVISPWHIFLKWTPNLVQITVFKQIVNLDFISAGWDTPILRRVTAGGTGGVQTHAQPQGPWHCRLSKFHCILLAANRQTYWQFCWFSHWRRIPKALTQNRLAWPPTSAVSPTSRLSFILFLAYSYLYQGSFYDSCLIFTPI